MLQDRFYVILYENPEKSRIRNDTYIHFVDRLKVLIEGNLTTIYGLIYFKPHKKSTGSDRRRRITFMYLLSNAVADSLIGCVVTPMALYQENNGWPAKFSCQLWVGIDVACCTASCLSLMVISLDRWFNTVRPIPPMWYNDRFPHYIIIGNIYSTRMYRKYVS